MDFPNRQFRSCNWITGLGIRGSKLQPQTLSSPNEWRKCKRGSQPSVGQAWFSNAPRNSDQSSIIIAPHFGGFLVGQPLQVPPKTKPSPAPHRLPQWPGWVP